MSSAPACEEVLFGREKLGYWPVAVYSHKSC